MSDLIPIGRFSQMTQLSIKALRLYAEDGLLYPTYVDPDSGYRYYSPAQIRLAARIRLLRSLEMPLEDIRAVIYAEDAEATKALLRQYQERIAGRIAQYQHTLLLLQRLIESKEEFMSYTINVKEVPAQPIVSIRTQIPPPTFAQSIPLIMNELINYAERLGAWRRDLPPIVIHHLYTEELADLELGLPVEHVVTGEGRITSSTLPGGTIAYVEHVGPYDELGLIYPALAAWAQEHGYETNGPARAAFWNDPDEVKDPSRYRTEVQWPIR